MSHPRFPSPVAFLGDRRIRVIVVGAGGTGSMLLDGLARLDCALRAQGHSGMNVIVYDDDTVSESNIGRQRFCRVDIGFSKAILMQHRLNAFYGLDWEARPERYDPKRERDLPDLLIGCVDRGDFRHALGAARARDNTDCLWCDTGNGADSGQVIIGHLGNPRRGQRLPNVYDFFGSELLAGDKDNAPSCSLAEALTRQRWSINPMVATVATSLLDKLFHRGGLDDHGALIRLDPLSVSPLAIDPAVWSSFGIDPARTGITKAAA